SGGGGAMKSGSRFLLILWAASLSVPVALVADSEPMITDDVRSLIDGGLEWMASQQEQSGAWSTGAPGGATQYRGAMTAYTLLAFMGTGNLPGEGPYGENVRLGVEYLKSNVLPDGRILTDNDRHYMYSHGIVTLALSQALGQTGDSEIRPVLTRMVELIVGSQKGNGWRYKPQPTKGDLSVSVVQCVALRAARNVGIPVPQETLDDAASFIRRCNIEDSVGFSYMTGGDKSSYPRLCAAAFSLQVLGLYDDPLVAPAIEEILNTRVHNQNAGGRLSYGDYYAAPAVYMTGGKHWEDWYAFIRDGFSKSANRNGTMVNWGNPGKRENGDKSAIYLTATRISILAIPHRFLPIYQE
ncbi:MAG: terpene cyclase/mutase family protein, partial [Kiritimatiellae bacterium]|nr:terpene cyclase/mutase family protein [Kiritimatiellia bacterium]